jgi:hypothetical protein
VLNLAVKYRLDHRFDPPESRTLRTPGGGMPTAASLSKKISESFDLSSVPKDKLDEYKATFALFDKNGNGKISASELGEVLAFLGQRPSEDELRVCVLFHNSS